MRSRDMFGRIMGVGAYVPPRVIENRELTAYAETDSAWIWERTGIKRRHVMTGETTSDMAIKAAQAALADAGADPISVDLILVSTASPDRIFPNTACRVQQALGAGRAWCLDLNAACTGFIAAMAMAQAQIRAGFVRTALVVAAEGLSSLIDWHDRGTCILFGDGAGAVLLEAHEEAVFDLVMHADGSRGDALTLSSPFACRGFPGAAGEGQEVTGCEAGGRMPADTLGEAEGCKTGGCLPTGGSVEVVDCGVSGWEAEGCKTGGCLPAGGSAVMPYVAMDGQAIFRFAVREIPICIRELLNGLDMAPEEIDLFLLHQANARILKSIAKHLGLPEEKLPVNVAEYGNTSSASIPILLAELKAAGQLERGQRLVLSGFGAGLTWGAVYLVY